jgi:hypothetical protein
MIVALIALVLAIGGTGYASQLRSGRSHATTAKRAKKPACVSGVSLCHKLRAAVDREIAAYVRAHRKRLVGPQGAQGPLGGQGPAGASGSAGAPGAAGIGIGGIFGNGADGSQSISGNTTLTRDMYYANLTVNPGVNLDTGGFRIFVSGTLTLEGGSSISRDGPSATASSPAAGLTPGSLGGSGGGANMGLCAGGGASNSLGGAGGTGASCPGGAVSRPAPSVGGPQAFDAALLAVSGRTLDGLVVSGGSGGGGGSTASGNGGGGGGVVIVAARSVSVPSSASITAIGGGNAGDGGGGGGGVVVVVSASPQPPGLTLSAAGGGSAPHTGQPGFTNWFS